MKTYHALRNLQVPHADFGVEEFVGTPPEGATLNGS